MPDCSIDDLVRRATSLREEIIAKLSRRQADEQTRDSLLAELATKYGCADLATAKDKLTEGQAKIAQAKAAIDAKLTELEQEMRGQ